MTGRFDVDSWVAAREEMRDLAERLEDLDDEKWNSPSLCAEWRIRDVVAHVIAGAEGVFGVGWVFRSMLRHGFNYNRWLAVDGPQRGRQDPAVLLLALQNAAANRTFPPRPVKSLMHVLIHGQDICRPLGITRDLPEAHLLLVADVVKDDSLILHAKNRFAGLKLTATDIDWSHGDGPEVTGPMEALVMTMAGRVVALDDLSGEGKAMLVSRR
jgi:uncharacterized protein (TIGR03083 family)